MMSDVEAALSIFGDGEVARWLAPAGHDPDVVLEATYGWYWAADVLQAVGARVRLAHPLGVKGLAYRRVKNDIRHAADLADLLRIGRLPEAWIAPPRFVSCANSCATGPSSSRCGPR